MRKATEDWEKQKTREIGERISMLAKQQRMTHAELARRSEISPSEMSRCTKGTRAPGCLPLARIAQALDTTTDYLINGEGETEAGKSAQKSGEPGSRIKIIEIATTYGYEAQSSVLAEEAAELIKAICKYSRAGYPARTAKGLYDYGKQGDEYKNLIEEMADVRVMLRQCEFLLGCADQVKAMEEEKVERQLQRIQDAENSVFLPDSKP